MILISINNTMMETVQEIKMATVISTMRMMGKNMKMMEMVIPTPLPRN